MKTTLIIKSNNYNIIECEHNPEYLFVFGDNQQRIGIGGQAQIRKCMNSIGIATKKSVGEFMHDEEYDENCISIDADIMNIKKSLTNWEYKAIVFPTAGLGWGRADIQTQCPRTALYLSQRLLEEFGFNNLADLVNSKQF